MYVLNPEITITKGNSRVLLTSESWNYFINLPLEYGQLLFDLNRITDSDDYLKFINFLIKEDIIIKIDSHLNIKIEPTSPPLPHLSVIKVITYDWNLETMNLFISDLNSINYILDLVELRLFDCRNSRFALPLLNKIKNSTYDITLIMSKKVALYLSTLDFTEIRNISRVLIINCDNGKEDIGLILPATTRVVLSTEKDTFIDSGKVHEKYMISNREFINLSRSHNNFLHGKIHIDFDGTLRNSPSMRESFGNIKDTKLSEVIDKPGFKEYWDINKDQIDVCRDCEFRYVCTDNRAYLEDPEDIYSKPLKCGYNPYTGEWSEWSDNPLKKKAIEYYGMQDLVNSKKADGTGDVPSKE